MLILARAIVEMGHIDGALLIRFSGWLRIAVLIGNYDRLENTPQCRRNRRAFAFHRAVFLNVHKIRVDSDNKRRARCTEMALTKSRKVKI